MASGTLLLKTAKPRAGGEPVRHARITEFDGDPEALTKAVEKATIRISKTLGRLGYRSDVRVRLTVPVTSLPEPRLGKTRRVQLGRTGVLGLKRDKPAKRTHLTVSLGTYEGLTCRVLPPAQSGDYRFE